MLDDIPQIERLETFMHLEDVPKVITDFLTTGWTLEEYKVLPDPIIPDVWRGWAIVSRSI